MDFKLIFIRNIHFFQAQGVLVKMRTYLHMADYLIQKNPILTGTLHTTIIRFDKNMF